ncbi:hypothetical protein GY45DRAFT_660413 [Cubamyces sp. BRFM 1775]|nr:hypothetical protein GY45DRAFT_660413 [Cubamyces sp. BRFM 1775]
MSCLARLSRGAAILPTAPVRSCRGCARRVQLLPRRATARAYFSPGRSVWRAVRAYAGTALDDTGLGGAGLLPRDSSKRLGGGLDGVGWRVHRYARRLGGTRSWPPPPGDGAGLGASVKRAISAWLAVRSTLPPPCSRRRRGVHLGSRASARSPSERGASTVDNPR